MSGKSKKELEEAESSFQLRRLLLTQLSKNKNSASTSKKKRNFEGSLTRSDDVLFSGIKSLEEFKELKSTSRRAQQLREVGLREAQVQDQLLLEGKRPRASLDASISKKRKVPPNPEILEQQQKELAVALEQKKIRAQHLIDHPPTPLGVKLVSRKEFEIELAQVRDPALSLHHLVQVRPAPDDSLTQFLAEKDLAAMNELSSPAPATCAQRPPLPLEYIATRRLTSDELLVSYPKLAASYAAGTPSCTLYLRNLPPSTTWQDLRPLFHRFSPHGEELEHKLFDKGRLRNQAFVTFPSVEIASSALALAHGYLLSDGHPLLVCFAQKRGALSS